MAPGYRPGATTRPVATPPKESARARTVDAEATAWQSVPPAAASDGAGRSQRPKVLSVHASAWPFRLHRQRGWDTRASPSPRRRWRECGWRHPSDQRSPAWPRRTPVIDMIPPVGAVLPPGVSAPQGRACGAPATQGGTRGRRRTGAGVGGGAVLVRVAQVPLPPGLRRRAGAPVVDISRARKVWESRLLPVSTERSSYVAAFPTKRGDQGPPDPGIPNGLPIYGRGMR